MYWIGWTIVVVLIADFIAGAIHWWEDTYGNPKWPIIGPLIIKPNIDHHTQPLLFTQSGFWLRNYQPFVGAAILSVVTYSLGAPLWLVAAVIVSGFGNEVHVWAHRPTWKNNRLIRFLQDCGFLQSAKQHAVHHHDPYDTNFCVMTPWVNPILEAIRFWTLVEWVISLFGIRTNRTSEVREDY